MTDPFEDLRMPLEPVDPEPSFAAHLRSRLESALGLSGGVLMSSLTLDAEPTLPEPAATALRHGDIGYASLWVPDVDHAAAFFAEVLDWRCVPGSGPHARQVIGRHPDHGLLGGQPHSTLFLCFAVGDVDAAADRVRAAGGAAGQPVTHAYGRVCDCVDHQGTRFALLEPPGGTSRARSPRGGQGGHGDLAYVVMEVADSAEARAFYGGVLGWEFAPGRSEDGWQVLRVQPMVGLSGSHTVATAVPMYQVDDVAAAVARVRKAGGTATDPEAQPYGVSSACSDDQGTRFYLAEL